MGVRAPCAIDIRQGKDYMGKGVGHDDVRYFEDYLVGAVYEFGSVLVEEEEIVDFARRYDPQVFHVDRELSHTAALGSPGVDELRWWKPVRPGDTLSVRITVTEARRSQSRPDRGVVRGLIEVLNQAGEMVTSWKGTQFVLLREPGRTESLGGNATQ